MAKDRTHKVHTFSRLISETPSGLCVYGCSYGSCVQTENRYRGEPSPFAVARAKRRNAARARRFSNAQGA